MAQREPAHRQQQPTTVYTAKKESATKDTLKWDPDVTWLPRETFAGASTAKREEWRTRLAGWTFVQVVAVSPDRVALRYQMWPKEVEGQPSFGAWGNAEVANQPALTVITQMLPIGSPDPSVIPPGTAFGLSGEAWRLLESYRIDTGDESPGWRIVPGRASAIDVSRDAPTLERNLAQLAREEAERTVPVIIDAIRELEGRDELETGTVRETLVAARCAYFVITSDVPLPTWDFNRAFTPDWVFTEMSTLGLVGVVMGPRSETPPEAGSVGPTMLGSAAAVASIFDMEDAEAGVWVEIEDVWLPVAWLPAPDDRASPEPGDVYRVSSGLFQDVYRYRSQELSLGALTSLETTGSIAYSAVETEAIRDWSQRVMNEAAAAYPKDPELALYDDGDGDV